MKNNKNNNSLRSDVNKKDYKPPSLKFGQFANFRKRIQIKVARQHIQSRKYKSSHYYTLLRATKNFGFIPSIHKESSLESKIFNAGLGHYVEPQVPVENQEFIECADSAISGFNGHNTKPPKDHVLFESIVLARKICKFPVKKFRPTSVSFASSKLNLSASAGCGYQGKKGKNDNVAKIKLNARLVMENERLHQSLIHNQPLVTAFRLQLRNDQKKRQSMRTIARKVRPIFMYPGHITLLEIRFLFPFINHFINLKDSFYSTGKNGQEVGDMLKSRLDGSKKFQISLDASRYDQSVINWLIISAFTIIRSQLQLDRADSVLFDELVVYFITSLVSIKVGKYHVITQKEDGIPSGSYGTNCIGTLIHAIVMSIIDPQVVESESCILCSDDNIFSTNKPLSYYTEKYWSVCGLTVKLDKSDVFLSKNKLSFLGYT